MTNKPNNKIIKQLYKDTIDQKIWKPECPVHIEKMKIVEVPYINFQKKEKTGFIMIREDIANVIYSIFIQLFAMKFPIAKINLINKYKGNDEHSMQDNNTSAFNCRMIMNTHKYSNHSMGTAIDINPVQNPYITKNKDGEIIILPKKGRQYLDRNNMRQGMISNEVVKLFKSYGFEWGGDWTKLKDYHHFELKE